MRPFKLKPYDAQRQEQTDAQRAATERNFAIFKIRGLWANAAMLMEPYRTAARVAIDADLRERGALTQREQEKAEREKRWKRIKPPIDDDDLPF